MAGHQGPDVISTRRLTRLRVTRLRLTWRCLTLAAAATALGLAACGPAAPPANLVVLGGPIITLDGADRRVEALAVRDGRIIVAGSAAEARRTAGPSTTVVDVGGRAVLPAFHDAHVHPVSAGVELGQCNLNGIESGEATLAAVAHCVEVQRGRSWLVGGGFLLTAFPGGSPTRQALDRLTGSQPAALSSSDGHTLWVNSAALSAAAITRATPIRRPAGSSVTGAASRPACCASRQPIW